MAGGRALVFDCWLTAKGISLPGVRTRAERQELRMYRRVLVKYIEAYRHKLSARIRGASVVWLGV